MQFLGHLVVAWLVFYETAKLFFQNGCVIFLSMGEHVCVLKGKIRLQEPGS